MDETTSGGLAELSVEECERLLEKSPIGRVGFRFAGKQVVLPVNYRYVDGAVLFRTLSGQKLHVAAASQQVAFEVDEWSEESRSGWSVLVKGHSERVFDHDTRLVADGVGPRPWADAAKTGEWIRVIPEEITGRWLS
jgi:nitroimidazol reductase NimA-like FMN-containing flavoprotein (pyridoxamine 5'-phosphate oxidase superfamily)